MHGIKENLHKIILTLLGILLIGYVMVAMTYSDIFLPGTTLNGVDVSNRTAKGAEELLAGKMGDYKINIVDKDGHKLTIDGKDIDLQYNFGEVLENAVKKQDKFRFLAARMGATENIDLVIPQTYDKDKLAAEMQKADFLDPAKMIAPTDANISYSDKSGFKMVHADEGTTFDREAFDVLVDEAITNAVPEINIADAELYAHPSVYDDDPSIKEITSQLDKVSDFTITYNFGSEDEVIGKDVIWTWIRKGQDGSLSISEDAVNAYIDDLCKKYDTANSERQFKTSKGETITVGPGPYGWKINASAEKEQLLKAVKEGKDVTLDPIYSKKGFKERNGVDDIGNTYVEVSINDQHMWYYKDGVLKLDTDVVTGVGGKHTLKGVCFIHNKARNATLVGPGYRSFVKYWMKVWNGIGIHDSSWRSSYGGKIYLTSGSHGCINTPLEKVIELYNTVEIGTPVVVY